MKKTKLTPKRTESRNPARKRMKGVFSEQKLKTLRRLSTELKIK